MASSPAPERLRVLVASDQLLVAEAVRAALASRGHEVVAIPWPRGARGAPRRRPPSTTVASTDVGLLLCDLDRWSRIHATRSVVERIRVPWLALTTTPRGPAWGSLLAAGVEVVVPGDTRISQISDLLAAVVRGQVATALDERIELEAAWREWRARHEDATERIGLLTPRERDVLRLMYEGSSVANIAETFAVAPATVRTQVKAVLRKLDVNTQLAAVAAFDDALDVFDLPEADGLAAPHPVPG